MNILVLSWRGPGHPLSGGAEQVMHEHMKGWVEAGHQVFLFTSTFKDAKSEEIIDGVKILRKGSQYLTVHFHAFIWYLFFKHVDFDLVVDQFHGWPFFTPLYVRKHKLAVIQELTREVWFRYQLPFKLNVFLGLIGYIIEPLFFVFYRNIHFMTGSQSALSELHSVGIPKKNITVISHGVILDLPQNIPPKQKPATVIFLGALAKDKGIEDAIITFGKLKSVVSHFWIVGRGDPYYQKYLQNLVKKLNIEKQTTFFGFVSQKEKFNLLARAHVMLNPSIREGWGLVNIEANAVGTPVIAYKSPGLIDSVKNGQSGLFCKQNTPEAMAELVYKLLSDKNKYSELSQGAIKWSQNFNWENSRGKSLELVNKIVIKE